MKMNNGTKKIRWLLLFCFLSLFAATGIFGPAVSVSYAQESTKEEESFYVAQKAFDDGFYDVAMSLLKRFLDNYPSSERASQANLLIGQCYFNQNKFLDALNKFEELLNRSESKDIQDALIYWIAEVHFRGNNFNKAKSYYQRIIDDYPNSSYVQAAYYSLGWCLFQEQKYREAITYFNKLEEKFPAQAQSRDSALKIVECLYNLKDYKGLKDKAKSYLKVYAKDSDKSSVITFYLAEADYYLDNFADAIEGFSKVIKNSADERIQALASMEMGWAYLKLKQYNQALQIFTQIKENALEKKSRDVLLLGRAILAFESGNYLEARDVYGQLIQSASETMVAVQAYLGKADAVYNLGEYKTSIGLYKEGLSKAASDASPGEIVDKLHYGLAWAFLKDGEFKEAIREFQKIVKSSEDRIVKASALCQIGDTYQDAGDYVRAQETYDTILKDYAESFYGDYVQYQLGVTLLKQSNYDAAVMSFLTLKKNYPKSKLVDDASYALGLAYFQRQDYNASKEVFQKFLEEFGDSLLRPQAMYLLGTSLYNLGAFNEAIETFKNVIRNYSHDVDLVQKSEYEIADCYYRLGNEQEAMNRFNSLRAKYPDSKLAAEIVWWLGQYNYVHNNPTVAKRYFSSLIQDFPKSELITDAYYALGSISTEDAKYEEALEYFQKVLELDKSDLAGQAAVAIADIYIKQDKSGSAVQAYKGVVDRYPHLANVIYPKVGDLFFKNGNFDDALAYYKKSLEVVPLKDTAEIQFKIGETLQSQSRIPDAIEEYLKVAYLYSENKDYAAKALLRVAKIYEDSDNFQEAQAVYKKLVSLEVPESKYAQERIEEILKNEKLENANK
jgi:TolA-binding protein